MRERRRTFEGSSLEAWGNSDEWSIRDTKPPGGAWWVELVDPDERPKRYEIKRRQGRKVLGVVRNLPEAIRFLDGLQSPERPEGDR